MDMTRRSFLAGGVTLGGLVAVARLPAFAEAPAPVPERGRSERLSISCHHIEAGVSKPFSVLHISDTHLTAAYPDENEWTREFMAKRSKTFGGRQEEALRESLAWAKEHVNYVMHTGDLIDALSRANLDLVRKYYGIGGATMGGSLGNHEFYHGQQGETEEGKAVSREQLSKAYPFDISLSSSVVNGVNFVTIDNVYGAVTTGQASRFEAEVKKGLPIILCMHCPFNTPEIYRSALKLWRKHVLKLNVIPNAKSWRDGYRDPDTKEFVAYLKSLPSLKGILAGHLHIDVQDRFSPTAMEYVVGGNYLFHGAKITFS